MRNCWILLTALGYGSSVWGIDRVPACWERLRQADRVEAAFLNYNPSVHHEVLLPLLVEAKILEGPDLRQTGYDFSGFRGTAFSSARFFNFLMSMLSRDNLFVTANVALTLKWAQQYAEAVGDPRAVSDFALAHLASNLVNRSASRWITAPERTIGVGDAIFQTFPSLVQIGQAVVDGHDVEPYPTRRRGEIERAMFLRSLQTLEQLLEQLGGDFDSESYLQNRTRDLVRDSARLRDSRLRKLSSRLKIDPEHRPPLRVGEYDVKYPNPRPRELDYDRFIFVNLSRRGPLSPLAPLLRHRLWTLTLGPREVGAAIRVPHRLAVCWLNDIHNFTRAAEKYLEAFE